MKYIHCVDSIAGEPAADSVDIWFKKWKDLESERLRVEISEFEEFPYERLSEIGLVIIHKSILPKDVLEGFAIKLIEKPQFEGSVAIVSGSGSNLHMLVEKSKGRVCYLKTQFNKQILHLKKRTSILFKALTDAKNLEQLVVAWEEFDFPPRNYLLDSMSILVQGFVVSDLVDLHAKGKHLEPNLLANECISKVDKLIEGRATALMYAKGMQNQVRESLWDPILNYNGDENDLAGFAKTKKLFCKIKSMSNMTAPQREDLRQIVYESYIELRSEAGGV